MQRIVADQIMAYTPLGQVIGTGALHLVSGKSPGVDLALAIDRMPVSQVKQLWPFFAGKGARQWVLANLFGGVVENSRLLVRTEPGRLGDGVPLSADEVEGHFEVRNTRFDVAGNIPPMRDADGVVDFAGTRIDIALEAGTVYMPSGRTVAASNGTLEIADASAHPLIGKLDVDVKGTAPAVTELASCDPIDISRFIDLRPEDFGGDISGKVTADIPLEDGIPVADLDWRVDLSYDGLSVDKPFDGQMLSAAKGTIVVDPKAAVIAAAGRLNNVPAQIDLIEPIGPDKRARRRDIRLTLDDAARHDLAPGLDGLVTGPVQVEVAGGTDGAEQIKADLTNAGLSLPWAGWAKDAGVSATASFAMRNQQGKTTLSDFRLSGPSFNIAGTVVLDGGELTSAQLETLKLNGGDDASATVTRANNSYAVTLRGRRFDARQVIAKYLSADDVADRQDDSAAAVVVDANVDTLSGYGGETLGNVHLAFRGTAGSIDSLRFTAATPKGNQITAIDTAAGGNRTVTARAGDTGALLRFLGFYDHLVGGEAMVSLAGDVGKPLRGHVEIGDFVVEDEPKLRSIVATPPPGSDRSLNDAVKRDIDVSRAEFARGSAEIEKGDDYLAISNGVLRGPLIGTTFQGRLFDHDGQINLTGTFMPAYGLNRIFGEIPVIGVILGNGRDRGLIGITYRLTGKTAAPRLEINPLSVVAPGIFRQIFEYR